jgi:hypothetical protein
VGRGKGMPNNVVEDGCALTKINFFNQRVTSVFVFGFKGIASIHAMYHGHSNIGGIHVEICHMCTGQKPEIVGVRRQTLNNGKTYTSLLFLYEDGIELSFKNIFQYMSDPFEMDRSSSNPCKL